MPADDLGGLFFSGLIPAEESSQCLNQRQDHRDKNRLEGEDHEPEFGNQPQLTIAGTASDLLFAVRVLAVVFQ